MDDLYTINWLGWNNDKEKGTQHDKVWGHLTMRDGRTFCFWGARGKTLRFKQHYDLWELTKLQGSKERKGYSHVREEDFDMLVKDFLEELEIHFMTKILEDKVL